MDIRDSNLPCPLGPFEPFERPEEFERAERFGGPESFERLDRLETEKPETVENRSNISKGSEGPKGAKGSKGTEGWRCSEGPKPKCPNESKGSKRSESIGMPETEMSEVFERPARIEHGSENDGKVRKACAFSHLDKRIACSPSRDELSLRLAVGVK